MKRALKRMTVHLLLVSMLLSLVSGIGPIVTSASAGLNVTPTYDKQQLVDFILGEGMVAEAIRITGAATAFGMFSGGSDIIGFEEGIILSTGTAEGVVGPNKGDSTLAKSQSTGHNLPGDPQLTVLSGQQTHDAAILEIDFIPEGSSISFQYVFSSEEYHEFANSNFGNDAFALFVNGVNKSLIPGTNEAVSINTINGGNPKGNTQEKIAKNPSYFINNDMKSNAAGNGPKLNLEMDGLTIVMSLTAEVNPGVLNTLKLAIADAHDGDYDSNVFIKAGSIKNRAVMPGEFAIGSRDELEVSIDRNQGSDGVVSVKWTAKDDQGVEVASGVVVFNDEETQKTFTVPGNTDTIELSNPIGGATIEADSLTQSLADIFDFNQTLAPSVSDIEADGTAATVTVDQVPPGATVIIYDEAGVEIGRGTNTSGAVASVTIPQVEDLVIGEEISVTLTESGKSESPAAVAMPVFAHSTPPSATLSAVNATSSEVVVPHVPAGASVQVYDTVSGDLIGTATNTGGAADQVVVTIAGGLGDQQAVEVTITELRKHESSVTALIAVQEVSDAPTSVGSAANATTNQVTIPNVPAGATVTVYDSVYGNVVIGTATNNGGEADQVVVTITGGLNDQQVVQAAITELRKSESSLTALTAVLDVSDAPAVSDIAADGTAAQITIHNVPTGVTVIVYNAVGDELRRTTQTGASSDSVVFEQVNALTIGEVIYVTFTEPDKDESTATAATPLFLQSGAPTTAGAAANATTNQVTIPHIPGGATVTVYDAVYGNILGTATNFNAGTDQVVVTMSGDLANDQVVAVTITELRKLESTSITLTAILDVSAAPAAQAIDADGTAARVTVNQVPAGATVIVYNANGAEMGRGTNTSTATASVTIEQVLALTFDERITVTIMEQDKSESAATTAMPVFAQSTAPSATLSVANATTNQVAVPNVPAGATVTLYDAVSGNVIGTATNTGDQDQTAPVMVPISGGLADQQAVQATITELRKLESTRTALRAVYDVTTWQPNATHLVANATGNTVTIKHVPAGVTVIIRDQQGNKLGEAVNTRAEAAELTVSSLHPVLVYKDKISVSFLIDNHAASQPVVVPVTKQSEPLAVDAIYVDVLAGKATIAQVPPGAEILIYDNGVIVGRATPIGSEHGPVVITGLSRYEAGDRLSFSITLPGQLESDHVELGLTLTNEQAVSEAARLLKIGYSAGDTWESVTSEIFLLAVGAYDTKVSWTSNKPASVRVPDSASSTIVADVVRQVREESVVLTATIEKNGVTKVRTFLVIVKAIGETKETINTGRIVRVINQDEDSVSVPVSRIYVKDAAGLLTSKIDKVILSTEKAQEIVARAAIQGNVSTILIDNLPGDEADEFAVEIPTSALSLLAGQFFDLNIQTEFATLSLSKDIVRQMNGNHLDLFFRLVPVKNEALRTEIVERLPATVEGETATIIGNPLTIETNYKDFATTLFIPFVSNQIDPNTDNLDKLRIYIEHSDGEKVIRQGTLVRDIHGVPTGLAIEISKFSTFTIIELQAVSTTGQMIWPHAGAGTAPNEHSDDEQEASEAEEAEVQHHAAYIAGYPDGTFRPERAITRAEIAALLARNLEKSPELAVTVQQPFNDIAQGHWAASYIGQAYGYGLITGYPDGSFQPNAAITRAEFAMIGARLKQLDLTSEPATSRYFGDLTNHWAASAIDVLKSENVLNGYPDGTFKPRSPLTRAEAVTAINRLFARGPLHGVFSAIWTDVDLTHWAAADIAEASLDHHYVVRPAGGEQWVEE